MSARTVSRRNAERKGKKAAGLHLVSLMDIFTILVFFLLVNSSDVEVLEIAPDVKLPDSVAQTQPRPDLVVSVSSGAVFVNGAQVVTLGELLGGDQVIAPLEQELRVRRADDDTQITIMADRGAPYALLKRIMKTCEAADYVQIAFAVNQQDDGSEDQPVENAS